MVAVEEVEGAVDALDVGADVVGPAAGRVATELEPPLLRVGSSAALANAYRVSRCRGSGEAEALPRAGWSAEGKEALPRPRDRGLPRAIDIRCSSPGWSGCRARRRPCVRLDHRSLNEDRHRAWHFIRQKTLFVWLWIGFPSLNETLGLVQCL